MKLKAYQNHLDHAILIPPPPVRESAQAQNGHRHKEGYGGWPSEVGGDASCGDADERSTANYLVLDEPPRARAAGGAGWGGVKERSAEVPEGWLRELGQMRERGLVSPSNSYKSAHTGYSSMSMPHVVTISHVHAVWISFSYAGGLVLLFGLCERVILARSVLKCTLPYRSDTSHSSYASHASNSVDGMVSRSSTVRTMIVEACGRGCVRACVDSAPQAMLMRTKVALRAGISGHSNLTNRLRIIRPHAIRLLLSSRRPSAMVLTSSGMSRGVLRLLCRRGPTRGTFV